MFPEAHALGISPLTVAFTDAHRRDLAKLASHRRLRARLGITSHSRRTARQA